VSRFLKAAEEIFGVARQAQGADCQWAILVGAAGDILVSAAQGWGLESLRLHHGAAAAYRVTRSGSSVRIEATCGAGAYRLESPHAAVQVRPVLYDRPQYHLEPAA
jgi:hypothetical protein